MSRKRKSIESYDHKDKKRTNNPPVGLVTPETDPDIGTQTYQHDPHIDPFLSWAGKKENHSFDVNTVSLHVHERIDPQSIIDYVRKTRSENRQPSLFSEEELPIRQAIEFYKHRHDWTNRFIAGDSLLVMNSLLQKEGMGKKIQMIYIDPPYGIKYGSNFQPFISQLDVKDQNDNHLTQEPEMIKAFRDTWQLGIHSYLTYLRDRLLIARDLLKESGSVFVQIGKENVHRVAILLEEIFGIDNRVATITYTTTGSSSANTLPEVSNYILWFAKNIKQVKYKQLYESRDRKGILDVFGSNARLELDDLSDRPISKVERNNPSLLPSNSKIYYSSNLSSQHISQTERFKSYTRDGITYNPPSNRQWSVKFEGLDRLFELGRVKETNASINLKVYENEHPGRKINNVWRGATSAKNKVYVVQTAEKIIERCILMATDPGDLVFDPTCGSGTTAHISEKWGRRWITCDTSRVALILAKKRLMTSVFDYYVLANPTEGIGSGFRYNSVKTVSAAILAYDWPKKEVILYNQPYKDSSKKRVTGPFTVEAVPPPIGRPKVKPVTKVIESESEPLADQSVSQQGESIRQSDWRDELLKSGIRGKNGQHFDFIRLEPLATTQCLHAQGDLRIRASDLLASSSTPPPRKF